MDVEEALQGLLSALPWEPRTPQAALECIAVGLYIF